jgi:hypothetical protein
MKIPDEARKAAAASECAYDCRCFAEHKIIGSSEDDYGLPWTPYALIAGALSVDEVNKRRAARYPQGLNTNTSRYFGFSGLQNVRFSLEPVDPETLETVRDPRILAVLDLTSKDHRRMSEDEWKDRRYVGPFARNI